MQSNNPPAQETAGTLAAQPLARENIRGRRQRLPRAAIEHAAVELLTQLDRVAGSCVIPITYDPLADLEHVCRDDNLGPEDEAYQQALATAEYDRDTIAGHPDAQAFVSTRHDGLRGEFEAHGFDTAPVEDCDWPDFYVLDCSLPTTSPTPKPEVFAGP